MSNELARETDRPAPTEEIEITPEMIEAGVDVGCLYDMREDRWPDVVREIYAAMRALERRG